MGSGDAAVLPPLKGLNAEASWWRLIKPTSIGQIQVTGEFMLLSH